MQSEKRMFLPDTCPENTQSIHKQENHIAPTRLLACRSFKPEPRTIQLGHGRKILDTTDEILVSWDLKHSGASQSSAAIENCQLSLEDGYLMLDVLPNTIETHPQMVTYTVGPVDLNIVRPMHDARQFPGKEKKR